MKVLALQVLTARIEDQIPPGSPDRTRLELRVPSDDYGIQPIGPDGLIMGKPDIENSLISWRHRP